MKGGEGGKGRKRAAQGGTPGIQEAIIIFSHVRKLGAELRELHVPDIRPPAPLPAPPRPSEHPVSKRQLHRQALVLRHAVVLPLRLALGLCDLDLPAALVRGAGGRGVGDAEEEPQHRLRLEQAAQAAAGAAGAAGARKSGRGGEGREGRREKEEGKGGG